MTKKKKGKKLDLLFVQILEAAPNRMFTEQERAGVRFLRFNRRIPCAECGKKVKIHWTCLYQFKCGDMKKSMFTLQFSDKVHLPLTPVCGDHPVAPHYEYENPADS